MDFNDTPEEAAFRTEARSWLDANVSRRNHPNQTWASTLSDKSSEAIVSLAREYQLKKHDGGWACLHWPKEFGGRGASPIERVIWGEEESRYLVPSGVFDIGQGMAGPVLMQYASEEQKQRYLPAMASGEEIWCQLFSETSAGSDLAGLRMKADRDGDDWILNGEKIWTSGAHYCDYGIIVARSDADVAKHRGLTFFFLDMKSPGIDVRPIKQLTGGSNFNTVVFNDVRIADSQRLGEIGGGWGVALTTLMNERVSVGDAPGPNLDQAVALAEAIELDGQPAIRNQAVRSQLAKWHCETAGLKYTKYRSISALSRGETPGPENSITKLVSAVKAQEIASFGLDLMDAAGIVTDETLVESDARFQFAYLAAPAMRIAGGTDEVLRNIIAERVLGLPQEPRVDKGMSFKDIPSGA